MLPRKSLEKYCFQTLAFGRLWNTTAVIAEAPEGADELILVTSHRPTEVPAPLANWARGDNTKKTSISLCLNLPE